MRAAALAALMTTLAVATLGVTPAPGGESDAAYRRAHAAAVRYHRQRDHVQRLLARRVREARALRRTLLHRASSVEAIGIAAVVYRVSADLLYRIASCESTGGDGLNPNARNPSSDAAGLAQALPSTWAASRFARFSPYSPYAAALFMASEVALGHAGWQWAASKGCWA